MRNIKPRYSVKRTLNIDRTEIACHICDKICKGERSLKSHITQMHKGPKDTSHRGKPKGTPAWNKGTGKPDTRNPEYIGKRGGYRPNSGRSKKFKCYDSYGNRTTLQSSYEHAVFEILCELGVLWHRPKVLKYDNKNYFADFYLPDYNIWLDPKNDWKITQDQEKINKVRQQNNVELIIIRKCEITKSFIARLLCR